MKQEQFERAKVLLEELECLKALEKDIRNVLPMEIDRTKSNALFFLDGPRNEVFRFDYDRFLEFHPVTKKIVELSIKQMHKCMLEQVEADIKLREEEFERL
jgi:hypothetical protein